MSKKIISWSTLSVDDPSIAHSLGDSLSRFIYGTPAEYDLAWKDIAVLTENDWRELINSMPPHNPETQQILKDKTNLVSPASRNKIHIGRIGAVRDLSFLFSRKYGKDDATLFALSLVGMVGKNGSAKARNIIGFEAPAYPEACKNFIHQMSGVVKDHHDDAAWKALSKITAEQWTELVTATAADGGVSPRVTAIIEIVIAVAGIVAGLVAAVLTIICCILALINAALGLFPAALVWLIMAVVCLIIAFGCAVAEILLLVGILVGDNMHMLESPSVKGIMLDGYWFTAPALAEA